MISPRFARLVGLTLLGSCAFAVQAEDVSNAVVEPEETLWVDKTVNQVTDYLGYSVNWFDGFFDDERYIEESNAKINLRWRNDFSYQQGDGSVNYKARVSARVVLPRFNSRLKLLIFADDEEYPADLESQGSVIDNDRTRGENSSIGLRYQLMEGLVEHLSLSGNLRIKPGRFITKLRHRVSWDLQEDLAAHLTTTGYWNTRDGFGSKLQATLEKSLDADTMLRWANTGVWEEVGRDRGVHWSSMATHYRKLSKKRAIAFSAGVSGYTRPVVEVNNYSARVRYRRNIFRPWMFFELAPEIYWPQDERRETCTTCLAMLARVEVVFRKWE